MKTLILSAIVLLSSCATVNYDQQADQQLSALSQEITLQFITWANQVEESPPSPVPYDAKFYDKVQADITALEIRMQASQSAATDKISGVFTSLFDQIQSVRKLHQKHGSFTQGDAAFLHAELDVLNAQIAPLMTFELSLKPRQVSGSGQPKTTSQATSSAATKAAAAGATVTEHLAGSSPQN